uniref:WH1 domain-containing protein n=1 Tax=Romanomermis culicivorax TaxID=13658 RepID=A0A915I7W9_ROMCU
MVTMSSNDGEQKFCEPSQYGILNRLYTCEAQVYVLSETTPGSPNWVELSDNVIPVHIVYNTEKNVYSILCVQHNKMIIDSPIDLNFVVMKGSPKFLQYHDSSTLRRYGVGFEVEKDAEK